MCKAICPHFVVPDVVASAEHYRDVLGFKIMGYWLDPPVFAIVARDDVEIQFGKSDNGALPSPNIVRRESGLHAFIWVDDLDALYAELQGRGAKILEAPVMRVYKCYELLVEDNFGFASAFRWIPVRFRVEIQQAQDPRNRMGSTRVC
jgi:catechol 2,3-dioxygenase-like lactoylglutathione lyase family enzyme